METPMPLNDPNDLSNLQQKDEVYTKSLCTFVVGANDGNLTISDINSDINQEYGDTLVEYTTVFMKSEAFVAENNQSGKCLVFQSYSNEYVRDNPERFCVPVKALGYEGWRTMMFYIAKHLRNYFRCEKTITLVFADLPEGEYEEVAI